MPTGAMTALMTVVVTVAALSMATALPFSGSPIINYNQTFYIYSSAWSSYCVVSTAPGTLSNLRCDVGLTTTVGASQFYISGGCGPVPSSALINEYIKLNNGAWCYIYPPANSPMVAIWCNQNTDPGPQYQISNINATSDGWLHGGATAVQFRSWVGGTNGWCSAQAASGGAYVQCNRASVGSWETFYFVPA